MLEKLTTHLQVILLGFADIADCIQEVKLLKKNSRTEIVPLPKTDPDIKCSLCIKITFFFSGKTDDIVFVTLKLTSSIFVFLRLLCLPCWADALFDHETAH